MTKQFVITPMVALARAPIRRKSVDKRTLLSLDGTRSEPISEVKQSGTYRTGLTHFVRKPSIAVANLPYGGPISLSALKRAW